MGLLKCVCCAAPDVDDHPAFLDDFWAAVRCPLCLASTPPCDTSDEAAAAWNAMQQALRAQDTEQGETMTVQIPVVGMASGDDRWVSVPWFDPRGSTMGEPVARVAQARLGGALSAGGGHGAAYVVTVTLPVPQPPQVIVGTAEAVGVGAAQVGQSVTYPDAEDADG